MILMPTTQPLTLPDRITRCRLWVPAPQSFRLLSDDAPPHREFRRAVMVASHARSSRYQREQRITVASWAILTLVGALSAAYHVWSTEPAAYSDDVLPPPMSMHAWLDESQPSINVLVSARNNIAAAASRRDIHGTGIACQTATNAVANLRMHMPSPEAAVNQSLQQAISSYTTGLPDCVSASRTVDGEGLQRAASYISRGDDAMQLALDILGNEAAPEPLGVLIV
jgi:hypothetical protein